MFNYILVFTFFRDKIVPSSVEYPESDIYYTLAVSFCSILFLVIFITKIMFDRMIRFIFI